MGYNVSSVSKLLQLRARQTSERTDVGGTRCHGEQDVHMRVHGREHLNRLVQAAVVVEASPAEADDDDLDEGDAVREAALEE